MRRWDRQVELYMEAYGQRGLSDERVQQVRRELDRFGSWLKRHRPKPKLEEVGADLITRYIQDRCAFRSKATVYGVMGILRGMGEHLSEEGLWQSSPLRWMRGPKMDPRAKIARRIPSSTMKQIWQTAATHRSGYRRYLWLTVMGLLYGTGLRRGELHRLDVSAWDADEQILKIDGRKSGRERQVAVPELTGRCLEAYLPQRQNHLEQTGRLEQSALLVDQCGGRLSANAISRGIAGLARRSGLERVTLHQFRHSCASDLLESGVQLPRVQQILGHRQIATTVRYLSIADPHRHQAVAKHPINTMLERGGVA